MSPPAIWPLDERVLGAVRAGACTASQVADRLQQGRGTPTVPMVQASLGRLRSAGLVAHRRISCPLCRGSAKVGIWIDAPSSPIQPPDATETKPT